MDKDIVAGKDAEMEKELLNSEHKAGTDWFTKLATVEKAKAFRREAQEARKGKSMTSAQRGNWSNSG